MSIARITEILGGYSAKTPAVANVTITNANTEYTYTIPDDTKKIAFSIQDGVSTDNYRIAYITGKVATPTAPYLKYNSDIEYSETNINLAGTTLYFAHSAGTKVAQIICWGGE